MLNSIFIKQSDGPGMVQQYVYPGLRNFAGWLGKETGTAAGEVVRSGGETVMNDVMPKIAPFLMLPIAMGLMGNIGKQPQQQQYNTNPQFNSIQPNYYGPGPINPQGFKTTMASYKEAGAGTTAILLGAIHKKLVNKALDKATQKKEEEKNIPSTVVNNVITPANSKTEKLLNSPKVENYVENLINN